jgi:hypothetical protein
VCVNRIRKSIGAEKTFGRDLTALEDMQVELRMILAFLSPRIIAAIADGTAAADFTVTGLAKALPYSWAEQERKIGLHSQ